ncbi:hypothetical protein BC829DRAFT_440774 [Chytridium lagenaria]|nr:hypothetical protein BC829DRAFT_440774 [Chytridium lagenaria]
MSPQLSIIKRGGASSKLPHQTRFPSPASRESPVTSYTHQAPTTQGIMTRPKEIPHDRHQQRQGGDIRGPLKKQGGGAHNWGTVEDEEEMVLQDTLNEGMAVGREDVKHVRVVSEEEFEKVREVGEVMVG